jgi:hypothetical protein
MRSNATGDIQATCGAREQVPGEPGLTQRPLSYARDCNFSLRVKKMVVSDQQHRILNTVRQDPRGWVTNSDLHAAIFGKTWPPDERTIPPLSSSQRASLSRSVRRLIEARLLTKTASGVYRIAENGDGANG